MASLVIVVLVSLFSVLFSEITENSKDHVKQVSNKCCNEPQPRFLRYSDLKVFVHDDSQKDFDEYINFEEHINPPGTFVNQCEASGYCRYNSSCQSLSELCYVTKTFQIRLPDKKPNEFNLSIINHFECGCLSQTNEVLLFEEKDCQEMQGNTTKKTPQP